MRKKEVSISVVIILLMSLSFILAAYVYTNPIPNPGHGADEVFISINGRNIDLQTAISDGEFSSPFTGIGSYSGPSFPQGHIGNEIIVNVNNTIKTFQQAINDGTLCNFTGGTNSSFGTITGQNQTGDEILIDISGEEKTLQQAISDGDFSACPPDPSGLDETQCNFFGYTWNPAVCTSRPSCGSACNHPDCDEIPGCFWNFCGGRGCGCGPATNSCQGTATCRAWSTPYCSLPEPTNLALEIGVATGGISCALGCSSTEGAPSSIIDNNTGTRMGGIHSSGLGGPRTITVTGNIQFPSPISEVSKIEFFGSCGGSQGSGNSMILYHTGGSTTSIPVDCGNSVHDGTWLNVERVVISIWGKSGRFGDGAGSAYINEVRVWGIQ